MITRIVPMQGIRNVISNELETAESWYKACLEYTLCNILFRERKYNEALDAFKEKAELYKGTPIEQDILINISKIYGDYLNDKEKSTLYANKASLINPGEEGLRFAYEAAGINNYIPASHEYRIIDPIPTATNPKKNLFHPMGKYQSPPTRSIQ